MQINSINSNRIPYVTLTVNEDSKNTTDFETSDLEDDESSLNFVDIVVNDSNDKTIVEDLTCKKAFEDQKTNTYNKDNDGDGDKIIEKEDNLNGLIKRFSLLTSINFGVIEKLHCDQLGKANLSPISYVYVTCASDPTNFTVYIFINKKFYFDYQLFFLEDVFIRTI